MKYKNLHNVKKTGFKAPDAYFESIEDRVVNRLNDDVNLDDKSDSGFKMPDNYIGSIEDKVFDTLNEDKAVKVIPLFSRRNILYVSGVAAAIMILFGIFLNGPTGLDDLDVDVVETYLEQQYLDTYDIASLLTDEDLSQEDFGIINDNLSEESLEDYLMDNANLEDIIEQ